MNNRTKAKRKSPQFLPALVAVSSACGLAAMPVDALELGDIQVNSALGQPLRASIAYALNANEQLKDYCIYLRPGGAANGIPGISNARVSLTDNTIVLTGATAIYEPILSMRIAVDCAYTPRLVREYTLMIDPVATLAAPKPIVDSDPAVENARQIQSTSPVRRESRPAGSSAIPDSATRSTAAKSTIATNTRYRVQPGDSVSTIAARIQDRNIGLWPAVEILFAANPDAFIDQDVNRLMAGSQLFIPSLVEGDAAGIEYDTNSSTPQSEQPGTNSELVGDLAAASNIVIDEEQPDAEEGTVAVVDAGQEIPAALETPIPDEPVAATTQVPELRPGDVFVSPIGPARREIVNPDAATDGPLVAVPIAHAEAADNNGTSGAWNWLLWLGGTGVALILGLLLFGRVLRERFGSFGFRKVEIPPRRRDDDPTQETRVVREIDFEFEDMINAQAISLDADLDAGTGLDPSTEIDVAQDFGFSASGQVDTEQLDLEITAEAAREPEEAPTDVIAPNHRQEMETILESEDPPSDDETEEYDMSMIVDATKQPLGDYDATAKDLHAVMVEVTGTDDDYTMDGTVDYRDLEQDYEEEFTATQAANAEIEKAALELARRMDEDDTFNVTAEMSTIGATEEILAPDRTIEQSTAEMPTVSDPDMTAELTSNLPTSIEAENDALADDGPSDVTVEMTAAGSDITIDTRLDTARIDTKGKRK